MRSSSSSVLKGAGLVKWKVLGSSPDDTNYRPKKEGVLAAGKVPVHLRSSAKVPFDKVSKAQKILQIGPCEELVTHPGVHPALPICYWGY